MTYSIFSSAFGQASYFTEFGQYMPQKTIQKIKNHTYDLAQVIINDLIKGIKTCFLYQ